MAADQEGYEYEFIVTPPKSLECPVCLLTLRNPHVISCCGNEFCELCIQRVQKDGKPCPTCDEPNFATMLHKKLTREIDAMMVRCPQKELGCKWEGELGQLQQHLDSLSESEGCGYVMVACAYKCGELLQRQRIKEHETDSCPRRPIEVQVASLTRKLEAVTAENQLVRKELEKTKHTFQEDLNVVKQAHQREIDRVNQECQRQISAVRYSLQVCQRDIDQLKQWQQKEIKSAEKTAALNRMSDWHY